MKQDAVNAVEVAPPPPQTQNKDEAFKFVFGSLVDLHKWFQSLTRDILVFSLLVIGWLVTSMYSRNYIKSNPPVLYISLGVVGMVFLLYLLECGRVLRESRRKMQQLASINYAQRAYYENYQVTFTMLGAGTLLVVVVFTLVCAVMLTV